MKRTVLMIAGFCCIQFMMAQWSTSPWFPAGPKVDDSFILTPDTLWFLDGNDFVEVAIRHCCTRARARKCAARRLL